MLADEKTGKTDPKCAAQAHGYDRPAGGPREISDATFTFVDLAILRGLTFRKDTQVSAGI